MLHVIAGALFKGVHHAIKTVPHLIRHKPSATGVTSPGHWMNAGSAAKHTNAFVLKQAKRGIRFPKL